MKLLLPFVLFFISFSSYALSGSSVDVKGFPQDKLSGKQGCLAAFMCRKKESDSTLEYKFKVWGNPKFWPGSIVFQNGDELKGEVALFTGGSDWSFVKRFALIVPEGDNVAYYVGPGEAFLITQKTKKADLVYDIYGDGYLERIVSDEPYRLSFNPAAGTSKKLTDFVSPVVMQDLQKNITKGTIKSALKDGKSVSESLDSAKNVNQSLTAIAASIEITEKEYLIFSSKTQKTLAVTKANYSNVFNSLASDCSQAEPKKVKKFAKKYKKIQKAIEYLNTVCK